MKFYTPETMRLSMRGLDFEGKGEYHTTDAQM